MRRPKVTSANEFLVRRMFLPVLLVGVLPTVAEAQGMSALLKRSSWTRKTWLIEQVVEDAFARLEAGRRPGA